MFSGGGLGAFTTPHTSQDNATVLCLGPWGPHRRGDGNPGHRDRVCLICVPRPARCGGREVLRQRGPAQATLTGAWSLAQLPPGPGPLPLVIPMVCPGARQPPAGPGWEDAQGGPGSPRGLGAQAVGRVRRGGGRGPVWACVTRGGGHRGGLPAAGGPLPGARVHPGACRRVPGAPAVEGQPLREGGARSRAGSRRRRRPPRPQDWRARRVCPACRASCTHVPRGRARAPGGGLGCAGLSRGHAASSPSRNSGPCGGLERRAPRAPSRRHLNPGE